MLTKKWKMLILLTCCLSLLNTDSFAKTYNQINKNQIHNYYESEIKKYIKRKEKYKNKNLTEYTKKIEEASQLLNAIDEASKDYEENLQRYQEGDKDAKQLVIAALNRMNSYAEPFNQLKKHLDLLIESYEQDEILPNKHYGERVHVYMTVPKKANLSRKKEDESAFEIVHSIKKADDLDDEETFQKKEINAALHHTSNNAENNLID